MSAKPLSRSTGVAAATRTIGNGLVIVGALLAMMLAIAGAIAYFTVVGRLSHRKAAALESSLQAPHTGVRETAAGERRT